jgi:hypothetical protein
VNLRSRRIGALLPARSVERFDAVDAGRRIEVLVLTPVLAFGAVLRCLRRSPNVNANDVTRG